MAKNSLKDVQWFNLFFMVSYHSFLFVGLPAYIYYLGFPSFGIVFSSIILFMVVGISITAGYHRLFSHKTYHANKFVQSFFLLFGTLAAQNSALEWSYDHRKHHNHTDTKKDPYSINKGFWYAHLLWLFEKPSKKDYSNIPDLANNPLLKFQDKYYRPIYIFGNASLTLAIGFLFNDFFGAIVFSYLLRTFLVHHMTFFINSLAHTWGTKHYSKELTAVDNYAISLLTFGEGYHNYHHAFPSDYRNGIKWYHFDPSKWLIWSLAKVGLANKLHRSNYKTRHLKNLG